jgi:uncharacterized protein (TIGR03000 family)
MFPKTLIRVGALLVAAGFVVLIPDISFAAPPGGGVHAGGSHNGGGYHSGGSYHYGSGYHNGDYYRPHYGGYYNNWYRYRPYYGGYNYYPYGYSDFWPQYNPTYSGLSYQPPISTAGGFALNDSNSNSDPPAAAPPSPSPAGASAHFTVNLPADAQLWLDNTPMTSAGAVREFVSPPLAQGWYTYNIKASWNENGQTVTQTQKVEFRSGAQVAVKFPIPQGAAPTPAAAGN